VAYPTVDYMRTLLPHEGEGFSDALIEQELRTAIERVVVVTSDPFGHEPLGVAAAFNFALAELLKRIFARDARSVLGREERSDPDVYVQHARDLLEDFKLKYPERFGLEPADPHASLTIKVGRTPWLA
jgi:hypothetical protein